MGAPGDCREVHASARKGNGGLTLRSAASCLHLILRIGYGSSSCDTGRGRRTSPQVWEASRIVEALEASTRWLPHFSSGPLGPAFFFCVDRFFVGPAQRARYHLELCVGQRGTN